ncbi:hypothetical protein J5N97_000076 [Dioscorea zingiberensis]|uniref:Uncharacterized protein n=1 Tax=Dioscorea zingiberensis TaxID=325984 RepID=A0A9D5H314_9LILI|nr:hypothetical protein J5N97_000076 [Dioscorea zingiberensis]
MALAGEEARAPKLRVFFIPFFASGHIIPMTDLACLFAKRPGVEPTMVITPANAALIRPTLDHSASSGHTVQLLLYPFPSAAHLPSGIENLGSVSSDDTWKIHKAVDLSREAHDRIIQLPEFLKHRNHLTSAWNDLKKSQLESYGVVVNTFYELEHEYCDYYREVDCRRAWFVGPVALCDEQGKAGRGGGESEAARENRERCMRWLGGKEAGSVLFVCFGSWCYFEDEQLREMALGLEASGMEFLWVVRGDHGEHVKTEWMSEGWEERVKGKGVWDGFRSTFEKEKVVVPAEAIERAVRKFMEGSGEGEEMRKRAAEWVKITEAAVAEGGSSHKDLNSLIDDLFVLQHERKNGKHIE